MKGLIYEREEVDWACKIWHEFVKGRRVLEEGSEGGNLEERNEG